MSVVYGGGIAEVVKNSVLSSILRHVRRQAVPVSVMHFYGGPGGVPRNQIKLPSYKDIHSSIYNVDDGDNFGVNMPAYYFGVDRLVHYMKNNLMGSCEHDKHLVPYVRALAHFNPSLRNLRAGGSGALSQDEAGFFPSSSLISKYMMRPEDSITYFEKDAFFLSELRKRTQGDLRCKVIEMDPFEASRKYLPPPRPLGVSVYDLEFLQNELGTIPDYDRLVEIADKQLHQWPTGTHVLFYPLTMDEEYFSANALYRALVKRGFTSVLGAEFLFPHHGGATALDMYSAVELWNLLCDNQAKIGFSSIAVEGEVPMQFKRVESVKDLSREALVLLHSVFGMKSEWVNAQSPEMGQQIGVGVCIVNPPEPEFIEHDLSDLLQSLTRILHYDQSYSFLRRSEFITGLNDDIAKLRTAPHRRTLDEVYAERIDDWFAQSQESYAKRLQQSESVNFPITDALRMDLSGDEYQSFVFWASHPTRDLIDDMKVPTFYSETMHNGTPFEHPGFQEVYEKLHTARLKNYIMNDVMPKMKRAPRADHLPSLDKKFGHIGAPGTNSMPVFTFEQKQLAHELYLRQLRKKL